MTDAPIILAPASLPQEQLLASDSTITLYHGSAGGGKTYALILAMVKYAAMQNSTIICFRRTAPQIRSPGSVWQEASRIFKQMFPDAKIRGRDLEIYIPSTNSVVKFAHLQYLSDVNNHLGSQYSVVIFDEATTFDPFEEFILPLMGRMRNAAVNYRPVMLWATNPRFDHGIYHWIKDFYLDENGIPSQEKSNVERYFVLKNNSPIWYDSLEEAEKMLTQVDVTKFASYRWGLKAGMAQGMEKGMEQGAMRERLRLAQQLIGLLDEQTIADKTGLSLEEVRQLTLH